MQLHFILNLFTHTVPNWHHRRSPFTSLSLCFHHSFKKSLFSWRFMNHSLSASLLGSFRPGRIYQQLILKATQLSGSKSHVNLSNVIRWLYPLKDGLRKNFSYCMCSEASEGSSESRPGISMLMSSELIQTRGDTRGHSEHAAEIIVYIHANPWVLLSPPTNL